LAAIAGGAVLAAASVADAGAVNVTSPISRLLAHAGVWEGSQIIPAQYMIDATTTRLSDTYLAPGNPMASASASIQPQS
jgi:hypothetical protein